ncbi:MAG: hypothetical protein ACJAVR_003376 [Paracoccaceae bacterium]|jgi:hypothetical protein
MLSHLGYRAGKRPVAHVLGGGEVATISVWHVGDDGGAADIDAPPRYAAPVRLATLTRPTRADFAGGQLDLVRGYGDLRGDRLAEITTQLGFPTAYFSAVIDLHPARNART